MGIMEILFGSGRPRELLITDVTRMQGERLCVAGVSGKDVVRLAEPPPTEALLQSFGGLKTGDVVQVKWERLRRYRPPHSEDCRWRPGSLAKSQALAPSELHARLRAIAVASLREAYGKPLFLAPKGNPAFPPGKGKRSLATVAVSRASVYRVSSGLRADFTDAEREWKMLPVESIALRSHFESCRECARVEGLRVERAILRIGLTRPFQPDGGSLGCFAQVNAVVCANPIESHPG